MPVNKRPWIAIAACLLITGCRNKPIVFHHEAENGTPGEERLTALPERISFNEHVQPVLSEYCYHCHGPDSGTRRPDKEPLRLDVEEEAFAVRDLGAPVIVKGRPEESELVRLIRSKDGGEVMPPPESHKVMGEREIAILEKWIAQGAEYEGHWSYQPVKRLAAMENEWSEKPIDGFVFEKLAEAGLEPNPGEDARRFHRRMSFDLTGLPPEPTETDSFVVAYEKDAEAAVSAEADRMLATVASAEHFARHWLDAARYADTHGIHIDNYRAIWPYRDWVVRAFQANMPWDQFTTEQIAGDLLPQPALDQKIATGFLRCLATTGEGGAIAEEYDAVYATDRVDTMGAVWLGLTASCASCHDHKFDPFSTKEFYQLTAFFRNNIMSSLDKNNAEHPPAVFVPLLEDREKWRDVQNGIADVERRIAARKKAATGDFETWLTNTEKPEPEETDSSLSVHLPLSEKSGPITGKVDGEARAWEFRPSRTGGPLGSAVVVTGSQIELGNIGTFSRGDKVTYGGYIWYEGAPQGAIIAKMDSTKNYRGWDLWFEGGKIGTHVIDSWDKSANKFMANKKLEPGKWHHVMFTFDGSASAHQAMAVYIDGEKSPGRPNPNTVGGSIETDVPLRLGSRAGNVAPVNTKVALQDFRLYRRLLRGSEISNLAEGGKIARWISLPADQRTGEQRKSLFNYYVSGIDSPSLALLREKDGLESERKALRDRGSASLVYEEKEKEKSEAFAHVLIRGDYTSKGEKVFPDTPAMLPAMPRGAPKDRSGLAMWLNEPSNPLPARVTMNRLWSYFFGAGIVETPGDFGIMGARPTHPKLLDWLASEFVESGWDYRHMAKTIVTSKAYRQSGAVTAEKLEKDPANLLISRSSRTRLDAEQIRDLALAGADILSEKVGGPPVKPYQPEGIWEAVAMPQSNTKNYRMDSGEALYRRSLYTFWKRTAAPPTMEILNAPTREISCVGRERTNTPLQALALMNDPQFVEAGRVLATKAVTATKSFDARLDLMTRRLLNRTFAAEERTTVKSTYEDAMNYYQENPEQARLAIAVGEKKVSEGASAIELAAWTLIANQLFNLDETVTR